MNRQAEEQLYEGHRESHFFFEEEEQAQAQNQEAQKLIRSHSISDENIPLGYAKDSVWSGQEGSTSYFSFFEQGMEDFTSEYGDFADLNRAASMKTSTNLYRPSFLEESEPYGDGNQEGQENLQENNCNAIQTIQFEAQQNKGCYPYHQQIKGSFSVGLNSRSEYQNNHLSDYLSEQPIQYRAFSAPQNIIRDRTQTIYEQTPYEYAQRSSSSPIDVINYENTIKMNDQMKCKSQNEEQNQLNEGDYTNAAADLLLTLPSTGFNYFQYFNQNQSKKPMNSQHSNNSGISTIQQEETHPMNNYNLGVDIFNISKNPIVEQDQCKSDNQNNNNNNYIRKQTKNKNKLNQSQSKIKKSMNPERLLSVIKQEEQDEDAQLHPRNNSMTDESFLEQNDAPIFPQQSHHFYGKTTPQCKEETLKEIEDMKQCNKKNVVKNIMNAFKNFVLDTEQKNSEHIKQRIVDLYNSQHSIKLSKQELNINHNNSDGDSHEEGIDSNSHSESLEEILKKFKRYINSKNFNHYSIRLVIIHPNYGPILRYFLEGPVYEWVSSSKVNDHTSHFIMINYLMLCFADIKFIEELKRHEKKKARFQ